MDSELKNNERARPDPDRSRDDAALDRRLADWLAAALGADRVIVSSRVVLGGGAIQENWLLDCEIESRGSQSHRRFVMRNDAPATIPESRSREEEFGIMSAAWRAGIQTPEPVGFCADLGITGKAFAVMHFVEGVGLGPKIVKDDALGGDRPTLAAALGRQLGLIHQIDPGDPALAMIDSSTSDHPGREIEQISTWLAANDIWRPALAWGLRWAHSHKPEGGEYTFLHRDFRTGNYMVNDQGLGAILDWEFAGYGDPMSDIGWFCAECWRFSRPDREAGGIADRQPFYDAYRAASGRDIDPDRVHFWEVIAHLRWALIALQQGQRHLSGEEPSLAMAITSRVVDHLELIVLRMTSPTDSPGKQPRSPAIASPDQASTAGQSVGENLAAIARQTLLGSVVPAAAADVRLPALMVNNALGILERELRFANLRRQADASLLSAAGSRDEKALSQQILAGTLDHNDALHTALHQRSAIAAHIYQPGCARSEELPAALHKEHAGHRPDSRAN